MSQKTYLLSVDRCVCLLKVHEETVINNEEAKCKKDQQHHYMYTMCMEVDTGDENSS